MKILVLQGANMAALGRREPEIYGTTTAAELDEMMRAHASARGCALAFFIRMSKRSVGSTRRQTTVSTACS